MKNYSNSRCPNCQNTKFEMVEDSPSGSKFKFNYVRCSYCKTLVGVLDHYNIGNLIYELAKKINVDLDS